MDDSTDLPSVETYIFDEIEKNDDVELTFNKLMKTLLFFDSTFVYVLVLTRECKVLSLKFV